MSRVIVEDYPHRLGGHCGSGALRDLLEWAGLDWEGVPDEGLVFGLGGGLSFMYTRYPGLTPPVYLVGRNANMELDFCRRLDIRTKRQQGDDPGKAWQIVRSEIDAGRPLMVWSDIAGLPYLRVRLSNTRHDIVVIGYDDGKQTVLIADNDREDFQEVPLDAFLRAQGSSGFPGPNRFATYPMDFPSRLPDLLDCARSAAAQASRVLLGEDALLFDASTLPKGSLVASGIEGVRTFANDIATWPYRMNPDELTMTVKSLPVFIEKAGTGGGLFRRLEAEFCADVARRTTDRAFAAAAEACRQSVDAWSALGVIARADPMDINAIGRAAGYLPAVEDTMQKALEKAGSR